MHVRAPSSKSERPSATPLERYHLKRFPDDSSPSSWSLMLLSWDLKGLFSNVSRDVFQPLLKLVLQPPLFYKNTVFLWSEVEFMGKSREDVIQVMLFLWIQRCIFLIATVLYNLELVLMEGPRDTQAILYAEWTGCLTWPAKILFSPKWVLLT